MKRFTKLINAKRVIQSIDYDRWVIFFINLSSINQASLFAEFSGDSGHLADKPTAVYSTRLICRVLQSRKK